MSDHMAFFLLATALTNMWAAVFCLLPLSREYAGRRTLAVAALGFCLSQMILGAVWMTW